jgi:phosphoribosylformylglycinamidine synthase
MRERGMTPYELMLSESQERMLLVVHGGREQEAASVFRRWGVDVETIGTITSDPRVVLTFGGKVVADLPVAPLVNEAPVYNRPFTLPDPARFVEGAIDLTLAPDDAAALRTLLASPNLCSKHAIWTQYDWSVRTNTVAGPGGDAAVLRVKGTRQGLAITADVNPRFVSADPQRGASHAVAEAALNVACTGARPLAITDCLNFGNPEKPEVMGQFAAAVKGISIACRVLETPVISGNVSLYNETDGRSILPTPTIGMVGLLDDVTRAVPMRFSHAGDLVALLGETRDEMGSSEYLATILGREEGPCPSLDLLASKALVNLLVELGQNGELSSAHDVSEGGLAVAFAEACTDGLGAEVNIQTSLLPTVMLYSESAPRAIISFPAVNARVVLEAAKRHEVPTSLLGRVAADRLRISINDEVSLEMETLEIRKISMESFELMMEATR